MQTEQMLVDVDSNLGNMIVKLMYISSNLHLFDSDESKVFKIILIA